MQLRKLRLKKGWSQEQLAQLSGLSVRTVQRIERGQTPSLETLKCLAAVFEIDLDELRQENTMTITHEQIETEQKAIEQVRDIKGFYSHLIKYLVVLVLLFIINFLTNPGYLWVWWVALGWGIGIVSHGLNVFEVFNLFGPEWEKKQVEKKLGRKL